MSGKCGFIADGYSRSFLILENEWHPEVKGTYRPMLGTERASLTTKIEQAGQRKGPDGKTDAGVADGEKLAACEVVAKLIGWDLTDHEGNAVELTPANAPKVEPHLMGRLLNIVAGWDIDDSPESQAERRKRAVRESVEAAALQKMVAEAEALAAKN